MINELEKIEMMLSRFFDGLTSNEEEQALYRYFHREDLPEALLRYKPVFSYFETGLAKEIAAVSPPRGRKVALQPPQRKFVWWSAAAVLLAGVLLSTYFLNRKTPFDPYEGSYIVRNGMRLTNTEQIRPELEKAFREAMKQQEGLSGFDDPIDEFEQYIANQKCQMVNQFTDPYAREEAKKIMKIDCNN